MHASIDAKGNGCKLAHRTWGVCIVSSWKELEKKNNDTHCNIVYIIQYNIILCMHICYGTLKCIFKMMRQKNGPVE